MRYLLFIVLLITGSTAYGQKNSSTETKENHWQLGLFYSPDLNLSGNQIEIDRYTGYGIDYSEYNFTAGITAIYYLLNNWALRSGVTYSDRKFTGTYYCYVCDFIRAPQPQDLDLKFVQIPMAIRYYPYRGKISLFGELGLLHQLMVERPKNSRLQENTYSMSGLMGAGIEYNLSRVLSAQLGIQYTQGIFKIFRKTDYSYRILGIQFTLMKAF